jgi:hypothetical protein
MFQPSDYDPNNVLALVNANLDFWVNSLALGDTYLLGTGTVSNFRGPFNRSAIPKDATGVFDAHDVGVNM